MLTKERLFRFAPYIVIALFLVLWPPFAGSALVGLLTKIIIFGLLAMTLDFVNGFCGLWSFCQGALFGVAAYTTGILINKFDVSSFWITAPTAVLMSVLVACLFGFVALRVSALYFLVITFALGQLVYSTALKWTPITGGSNGLGGIPYPDFGFPISWSYISYYYLVLVICVICFLLLYRIIKSPFGLSIQGIRENEIRMRLLGYNTWMLKYISFIIGGLFAGVAGILYIHYNAAIAPTQVGVATSGLVWFIIIIGGAGTLWGALLGSAIVALLQYYISIFTPERWPIVFGACFVLAVMFLRGGIFPRLRNLWAKVSQP